MRIMEIQRVSGIGLVIMVSVVFSCAVIPLLWGDSAISSTNSPLVDDLLEEEQTQLESQYETLQQEINDQIAAAYAALNGASEGKEGRAKGLQNASKALQAIASMIAQSNPFLAGVLTTIAGIMDLQASQDQSSADQANQQSSTGQTVSVSEELQKKLEDLAAKIAAIQAERDGTSSSDTSTDALTEALEKVYEFVLGTDWEEALGISTTSSETSDEISDIESDVTDLTDDETDLSRSAVRNYQDNVHAEINQAIAHHTGE